LELGEHETPTVYLGHPDAYVTITHSDDIAKVIVNSLLPTHLSDLSTRRYIVLAGSTLSTSSLFDAISYVVRHPINVKYQALGSSSASDRQSTQPEDSLRGRLASLRRCLGFGGFELKEKNEDRSKNVITTDGRDYMDGAAPKTWTEVVHDFFRVEATTRPRSSSIENIIHDRGRQK